MPDAPVVPATPLAPDPSATRRIRSGSWRGLVLLVGALLAACGLSLLVGSDGILGLSDGLGLSTVEGLRLPRTALAVAVGAALGLAGALMQGHTRNPLAEPGLLGVSEGAALAVVVGMAYLGVTDVSGYAWFALLGAGVTATAVFAIASAPGGPHPVTLVLAGAAVSALVSSFTSAIVLREPQALDDFRIWVVGSLDGRDLGVLWQVLPFLLLGLLLAAATAPGLNVLQLGDDVARSLGMHPMRHKIMGIAAVMLLTGAATAACGPIVFVGLVVPHVARFLAGVDYRWILPYAALVGALLVLLADVLGRVMAPPGELQVGIVMALIGGPAFILLVRRARLVRL
jgi:iron-siderophore transport system permease protein